MAQCKILLNSGDFLLLNTGDNILLNDNTCVESGGGVVLEGDFTRPSLISGTKPRREIDVEFICWIKADVVQDVKEEYQVKADLLIESKTHAKIKSDVIVEMEQLNKYIRADLIVEGIPLEIKLEEGDKKHRYTWKLESYSTVKKIKEKLRQRLLKFGGS